MSSRWAICLAKDRADAAASLRQTAGVEVCQQGDLIWLRGGTADETLDLRLRAVPGARRFGVLPDGQLVASSARVPKGRLPDGPWAPIKNWIELCLDPPALAGQVDARVPLQLVRSTSVEDPSILQTTVNRWKVYGAGAPRVRLDRWYHAAADDRRVIVRGTPLPPLPGVRLVERQGIAVEAGWTWSPAVDAATIRHLLALQPNDLALLLPDGTWQLIAAADFVRASRSAIRALGEDACDG